MMMRIAMIESGHVGMVSGACFADVGPVARVEMASVDSDAATLDARGCAL